MSGQPDPQPNPYQPPALPPEASPERQAPGLGRMGFALWLTAALVPAFFLFMVFTFHGPSLRWTSQIPFALVAIPRLRNLGYPGWVALLVLIPYPILALLLMIPCLCLPPDYRTHRHLDRTANLIMTALAFLLALAAVPIVLAIYR